MKKKTWIPIVVALFFIFIIIDALVIEPNRITVEKVTLDTKKLGNPLRIVQISDLHLHNIGTHERRVIDRVNAMQPDLIMVTGDLFPASEVLEPTRMPEFNKHLDDVVQFVTALDARYGVWVIRGNDDFSNDKEISDLMPQALTALGIPVLTNTDTLLQVGGDTLYLAGVDFTGLNIRDIADFDVTDLAGSHVMHSPWSRKNSYSHFSKIADRSAWHDYTMTGRLRKSRTSKDGIGVTFYSQMDIGYDRFYRLRQANTNGTFHFSPHGTPVFGDSLDTGFSPEAGRWVRFKIACVTLPHATAMRAKVWYENDPEPHDWMATAYDTSASRLYYGSPGLWSGGLGDHYYDDICVVNAAGDTLLDDGFEDLKSGKNPPGWVDFGYPDGAINLLFQNVPAKYFTLLLVHSPDYAVAASKNRVDLVLSGHTHGGQVRLPIIGPLYKNMVLEKKYMQGLHKFADTQFYVNRGIGTVLFPARLLCPPEITIIELRPGK